MPECTWFDVLLWYHLCLDECEQKRSVSIFDHGETFNNNDNNNNTNNDNDNNNNTDNCNDDLISMMHVK